MVRCQICKRLLKYINALHLRMHDITIEEYKKKYNVEHLQCKSLRKATSRRLKENDYALNCEWSKEAKKNQSKRLEGNKRALGNIKSEEGIERIREANKGNDYAVGHIYSEENKEKARIRIIQLHKDGKMMGCERCKMYPVMNYVLGKKVKVQGRLEVRFAKLLNKLRIRWRRPKPKTYVLDDKEHKYFCDFWLPDEKLYVEVKSRYYYNKNKKEVKTKKKMMIKRGKRKGFRYKIMFEKDIREFELNVRDVAETLINKK